MPPFQNFQLSVKHLVGITVTILMTLFDEFSDFSVPVAFLVFLSELLPEGSEFIRVDTWSERLDKFVHYDMHDEEGDFQINQA